MLDYRGTNYAPNPSAGLFLVQFVGRLCDDVRFQAGASVQGSYIDRLSCLGKSSLSAQRLRSKAMKWTGGMA